MKSMLFAFMATLVGGYFSITEVRFQPIAMAVQDQTFGAVKCNHEESQLWCHTGTAKCEGSCPADNVLECKESETTQSKASSGSIYRCAAAGGAETRIHCAPNDTEPVQSCERTTRCRCMAVAGGNGKRECKEQAHVDTISRPNITESTNCTN